MTSTDLTHVSNGCTILLYLNTQSLFKDFPTHGHDLVSSVWHTIYLHKSLLVGAFISIR